VPGNSKPPKPIDVAKQAQAIGQATAYLARLSPPQSRCTQVEADAINALALKGGINGTGAPCVQYTDGPTVQLWRLWSQEKGAAPDQSKQIPDPQNPKKSIYVPASIVTTTAMGKT
jgi:hypothetical protein